MAEIPEEALKAAADAHEAWHLDRGGDPDQVYYSSHEQWSRGLLEAVAPILAAHIARRIRAQQPAGNTRLTWRSARDRAARVVRETYPPKEQP